MSVDYTAHSIIGIKLNANDIQKVVKKTVKAFKHDYPDTMHFDPTTGKALWSLEDDDIYIDGYDDGDGDPTLFGYELFEDKSNDWYLCAKHWSIGDYGKAEVASLEFVDIDRFQADIKSLLEPVGLWNEKMFGLWTILGVS